jgi:hypothetical protein
MEYYNIMGLLQDLNKKELTRIIKSYKEYLVLNVSVFNVGAVVKPILTDNYNRYKNINRDGYSCILPLDYELVATIEEILENK